MGMLAGFMVRLGEKVPCRLILWEKRDNMITKATMGRLAGVELRPTQIEGIERIRNSEKKIVGVRAPTGVGKTCLAYESTDPPFFYVCNSISLQHQALSEYPRESVLLKGRSNYPCPYFLTADLCMAKKRCYECEYEMAKEQALKHCKRSVLNFHYFLHTANFTKNFPIRNIIIDEADDLDKVLINFISFDFQFKALENWGITVGKPKKKTVMWSVKEWLDDVREESSVLEKELEHKKNIIMRGGLRKLTNYEIFQIRKWQKVKSLNWKLGVLESQDLENNWVYQTSELRGQEKIQLKPKWLSRKLVDTFLLSHGNRFLMMSATLPSKPVLCGMFGLEDEEVEYIDLPNVWDNKDRKVVYRGSYSLSHKGETVDDLIVDCVKEILDEHEGRGVIHTVNYRLSKLMGEMTGVDGRIMTHTAKNKGEMLRKYKETPGAVFVSPSSTRGLDLPDDLCDFIIMLKAPFLQLNDPQVKARLYGSGSFGKLWYTDDTIRTIIQACGRGYRHEFDHLTVYLLDKQIGRLLKDNARLWPMWFRELIKWEERE